MMSKREMTFAQAINETLRQEMRRDPRVFVIGENVSSDWRETTRGLMKEFGKERVRDTPITETSFTGAGIGAAIAGMRPVVELMLVDFALVAMDQILNQAAKTRYMLGGKVSVPITMRASYGAGTSSGATHSETLYSLFAHMPGLKIAVPSNAYDAKGLLTSCLRDDDPKIFFEHRLLMQTKSIVPEEAYTIPFGKAEKARDGKDLTIVALGLMVSKACEAAEHLSEQGISAEVIDPRTIVPMDKAAILASVKKTTKLLVVDEDYERCGFSAEVAAVVADEGFRHLSAPIKRIAVPNVPIPYSAKLEKAVIPDIKKIVQTAQNLVKSET